MDIDRNPRAWLAEACGFIYQASDVAKLFGRFCAQTALCIAFWLNACGFLWLYCICCFVVLIDSFDSLCVLVGVESAFKKWRFNILANEQNDL